MSGTPPDCWHSSWIRRWFTNHPSAGEDPCLHLVEDEDIGFGMHVEDWKCRRCPNLGPLTYGPYPVGTSALEWKRLSEEERKKRVDEAFKPWKAEWALRGWIEGMMWKAHGLLLRGHGKEALAATGAALHAKDALAAVRGGDAKAALAAVDLASERLREAGVTV